MTCYRARLAARCIVLFSLASAASFAQPGSTIAGNPNPGTSDYPGAGMVARGLVNLDHPDEGPANSFLVDDARRRAYVGIDTGTGNYPYGQGPGRIVRLDLDDFTRVDSISVGERTYLSDAVAMDPSGEFAYYGTSEEAAGVLKVDLAKFELVGRLDLVGPEFPPLPGGVENADLHVEFIEIDSTGAFAYVGLDGTSEWVAKVSLSTFSQTANLIMESGHGRPQSMAIDSANGAAYLATYSSALVSRVLKIDLASFDVEAAIEVEGVFRLHEAILDAPRSAAYFFDNYGAGASGRVAKVDLSSFEHVATVQLPLVDLAPQGVSIDPSGQAILMGTAASPVRVARLDLNDFSYQGTTVYEGYEKGVGALGVDAATGSAFVATREIPSRVIKLDLASMEVEGALLLEPKDAFFTASAFDVADGHVYFGMEAARGRLVKFDAGGMRRVGRLDLGEGQSRPQAVALHSEARTGYVVVDSAPAGKILKVDLDQFAVSGETDLPLDRRLSSFAAVDAPRNALYVESGGELLRYALDSLALVDALPLPVPPGETGWGLIDVASARLYVGCPPGEPGSEADPRPAIHSVDLKQFILDGEVRLEAEEWNNSVAALDATGRAIYLAATGSPATMLKIGLSPFQREETLQIGPAGFFMRSLAIDETAREAFLSVTGATIKRAILRFDLDVFAQTGLLRMEPFGLPATHAFSLGASRELLLFSDGQRGNPSRGIKLQIDQGQRGLLKATRFELAESADVNLARFYSHLPEGNYRLALYNDAEPKQLLWESEAIANNATDFAPVVPISLGAPASLTLAPGAYWLAWQVDTTASVPSYAEGELGDGFLFAQPFGPAPATLSSTQITTTNERWTEHIVYNLGLSDGTALMVR
jgi:DNA-binding beta-propeller fold protein YncE